MTPPSNQLLHTAVVNRFHETISRFPPPHAPGVVPLSEPPYRIGEYLVHLGYLLPRELATVLHAWHHQTAQPSIPLGCLLVAHDVVPAPVLAMVLLLQWLDRWEHIPSLPPRFLGEQLLVDAVLTPDQVALVVREQVVDYQHGTWTRLDDLIVRHGWLDQLAPIADRRAGAARRHLPDQI